MEITTLLLAALLSLGFIGADAALTKGTIGLRLEVASEVAKNGPTKAVLDELVSASINKLSTYRSVIQPPTIKLSDEKTIVTVLQDTLGLKDTTEAFQSQFGLDPVRAYGSLMSTTTAGRGCGLGGAAQPADAAASGAGPVRYRFLIAGSSEHTGSFNIDCTSAVGESLVEFVDDVSFELIGTLEPYAGVMLQFKALTEHLGHGPVDVRRLERDALNRLRFINSREDRDMSAVAAFENLLGLTYLLADDRKRAAEHLRLAHEASDDFGMVGVNQAVVALLDGRADDALASATQAGSAPDVGSAPGLAANAATIAGLAQWVKGDVAQAEAGFRKALGLNPNSFFANYYLSSLLFATGHPDDGKAYRTVAQTSFKTLEVYPEIGLLYFLGHVDATGQIAFKKVRLDNETALEEIEASLG